MVGPGVMGEYSFDIEFRDIAFGGTCTEESMWRRSLVFSRASVTSDDVRHDWRSE